MMIAQVRDGAKDWVKDDVGKGARDGVGVRLGTVLPATHWRRRWRRVRGRRGCACRLLIREVTHDCRGEANMKERKLKVHSLETDAAGG